MKMKKMFRKSLAVLMAVCMLVQLFGVSNAIGDESFTEIIIGCDVDCQKAQVIIDSIKAEDNATIMSPLCLMLGHTTAITSFVEITHRVRPAPPRCLQETFRVTYCTRAGCNYSVATKIGDSFIPCCP